MKMNIKSCLLVLLCFLTILTASCSSAAGSSTSSNSGRSDESAPQSEYADAESTAAAYSAMMTAEADSLEEEAGAALTTTSALGFTSAAYADTATVYEDKTSYKTSDLLDDLFNQKIDDLKQKYGMLTRGESVSHLDSDQYYTTNVPADAVSYGTGILLTDLFDYDMDGNPELLVVRRENGHIGVDTGDDVIDSIRSEYIFEVYEADQNGCVLADSITIGVFDIMNWSVNFTDMSVFRLETDDETSLFIETYIEQQDHPDDTSLIKLSYKNKELSFENGVRFGYWFRESGVLCLEPASENAIDYLSYIFPSSLTFWDTITSSEEFDEHFLSARNKKLKELGLAPVQTRLDIQKEYDQSEMGEDEFDEMNSRLRNVTAADCYIAADGSITMLAFLNEYTDRSTDSDNQVGVVRNIEVYTGESDGRKNDSINTEVQAEDYSQESSQETFSEEEYILPDSDKRLLELEDLEGLDEETLMLARNEIYARHGRRFKDQTIQSYFDSRSWYQGTILPEDFSEDILNETEKVNAEFILNYENSLKNSDTYEYVINELQGLWYSNTMGPDGPMKRMTCEGNYFNGEIAEIVEYQDGFLVRIAGGYSYYFGDDLSSCMYVDGWETTEDNTYGTNGWWKPNEEQRKQFGD